MKKNWKFLFVVIIALNTIELLNAQAKTSDTKTSDTTITSVVFLPILKRLAEADYRIKDEDLEAKWVQSEISLKLVKGDNSDSLSLYSYNLKTTKAVLIKLIKNSTKSESLELKNVIDFIEKVDENELNNSDYGKMVDKTIVNRFGNKQDKNGIKLSFNVLSMLLKTEIEYNIISKICSSIYDLNTKDVYIGGGSRCGFESKKMELLQSDINLLSFKGMEFIVTDGLNSINGYEFWDYSKRELFPICFFSARYYRLNKKLNLDVNWDSFINLYKENIELTNENTKNDLYKFLSYNFNISSSNLEKIVNINALIDFFILWKLEKNSIAKLTIPKDYENNKIFAQIKKSYPELNEVRLSDYKEYVYKNFYSNRTNKIEITYSFYDCLNDYIESIPRLSRPNFDNKTFEIPILTLVDFYEPYFEGVTGNRSTIEINFKQKKDTLSIELNDRYSKFDELQKDYEKNIEHEDDLPMNEMNKHNQRKLFFGEIDKTTTSGINFLSLALPMLFDNEKELKDFFIFFKESNKKYINSLITENRKSASRKFDDNYSPGSDTIINQLMFLNPLFKKSISKFQKTKSKFVKVFSDEVEMSSEDYQNSLIKLSKLDVGTIKSFVDRYNERNSKVENRFKNLSEYFNSNFEFKKKNTGIIRDRFSGLTNYVVNREWTDRITGDATFFWNNLNDVEIVTTINPTGARPITINLKGKIIKNANSQNSSKWPYVFVIETPSGSKGDKFYIRFEDFKCYSNIEFAGSGRSNNIFFTFGIIL